MGVLYYDHTIVPFGGYMNEVIAQVLLLALFQFYMKSDKVYLDIRGTLYSRQVA